MKEYRSIDGPAKAPHKPCYGFVKYDGSNLRSEWSKKRGWYKFGTRTQGLDPNDPIFGRAVPLFLNKYGDDLAKVFLTDKQFRGVEHVTAYFEFFGTKSFAGMHFPDDIAWDVVLFDIDPFKRCMLGPKEFIDAFGHLKVAECVFQGNMGPEIIQKVSDGTFDCASKYEIKTEVPEGLIVKGDRRHKLWMRKIKTDNYRAELKKRFVLDWEKYWY
jgi:hypothetical protein